MLHRHDEGFATTGENLDYFQPPGEPRRTIAGRSFKPERAKRISRPRWSSYGIGSVEVLTRNPYSEFFELFVLPSLGEDSRSYKDNPFLEP